MKTKILFLNPPSLSRFDSAGSRFQATRKAKTMWYPTWLAYAAGLAETKFEVKLIDAPAENINIHQLIREISKFEPKLVIVNTSTPSFSNDISVCEEIYNYLGKDVKIVLTGPHVSVLPEESLRSSESIWGVARKEFEYTIFELAEAIESGDENYEKILGLSWKSDNKIIHNPERPFIDDLDKLPFVTKVYKKHLNISKYYLAFALYPYVSIYSGRGCPARCTFCLWPQTISGRKFRMRSPENVVEEMKYVSEELPEVKEIFFDDDTFTANRERVHRICDLIRSEKVHITWSANARADLDLETLKKMKDAGCRLLVVGYESGDQNILNNIKKGITIKQMEKFTQNAKKAGLMIHGTFIIGLPGENKETIKKTIEFAKKLNPDTVQFSVATPFPGTEFYNWCIKNNVLKTSDFKSWIDGSGYQSSIIEYPNLSAEEIVDAVDYATISFYFRPGYFLSLFKQIMKDRREISRIWLSGSEFLKYSIKYMFKRVIGRENEGIYH